jgi:hypothetical protein
MEWKNLPKEIQERMLECQVEQGNKRDESVFEENINYNKNSGGFHWADTAEGHSFWNRIIYNRDTGLFYGKYPKKENNTKEPLDEAIELLKNLYDNHVCCSYGTSLIGDLLVKIDDDIIGNNGCGTIFTKDDVGKSVFHAGIFDEYDDMEKFMVFEIKAYDGMSFNSTDKTSPSFKTRKELFDWIEDNWK